MITCNKKVEKKKVKISRNAIKRTGKVRFLGIMIDDRLSFIDHVRVLQKQVSMDSGILNKVSKLIPVEVKLNAYYALIYSKLIYGLLSWI